MTLSENYKKNFIKCLESIDYTKRKFEIFQDFLAVSTFALSNVILKDENVEKQYFEIIEKYKNPEKLSELLSITVMALDNKIHDFLGEVYMFGDFGNKNSGQFFTPYHISQFMAECVFDKNNVEQIIKQEGFIKVSEPCCGAGGMLLAFSETMLKNEINPQKFMVFQGIDIDINCCRMAFIQTSLIGLTGEIIHGDTISLKTWNGFVTPMTLLNMNNYQKFKESPKQKIKEKEIINQKYLQLKIL